MRRRPWLCIQSWPMPTEAGLKLPATNENKYNKYFNFVIFNTDSLTLNKTEMIPAESHWTTNNAAATDNTPVSEPHCLTPIALIASQSGQCWSRATPSWLGQALWPSWPPLTWPLCTNWPALPRQPRGGARPCDCAADPSPGDNTKRDDANIY